MLLAWGVLGLFLQLRDVVLGGTAVLVSVGFDLLTGKVVLVVCACACVKCSCWCMCVMLNDGACAHASFVRVLLFDASQAN